MSRPHLKCWLEGAGERYVHVCQEPSGKTCIEDDCGQVAGTWWGPYWCPDHDVERLNNISAGLADVLTALERIRRS